jgi:hypothetical protein
MKSNHLGSGLSRSGSEIIYTYSDKAKSFGSDRIQIPNTGLQDVLARLSLIHTGTQFLRFFCSRDISIYIFNLLFSKEYEIVNFASFAILVQSLFLPSP